jgi:hypothetical protein
MMAIGPTLAKGVSGDDLETFVAGVWSVDKIKDPIVGPMLSMPGFRSFAGFAARWAMCGFPAVSVGHRLTASLMSTTVSPDIIGEIVFPWPAFSVNIPHGLISTISPQSGLAESISNACIHRYVDAAGDVWFDLICAADTCELQSVNVRADVFFRDDSRESLADGEFCVGVDESDERALLLVRRLLVGVCIEMSDRANSKPQNKKARMGCHGVIDRNAPGMSLWLLTRDVKIDAREACREFVSHGGRSPAVQSMVRGHHKRQAHGRNGSLRKWIHVEPYWRGPEDAPIAVRSHRLDDGAAS